MQTQSSHTCDTIETKIHRT